MIESLRKSLIIIFTNYLTLINIIKQIILNTSNINKLNLRLIKTS